jgi:hypothetical protein
MQAMDDATLSTEATHAAICPWCSATIRPDSATCPSCGAILISDDVAELPGVTEIDPKVARGEKQPPPRNRILSWISGEYPDPDAVPADPQALAPPDPDVQREILRLQLQAEVANLQAEADAMRSDAIFEGRTAEAEEIAEAEVEAGIPAAEAEAGIEAAKTDVPTPAADEGAPPA